MKPALYLAAALAAAVTLDCGSAAANTCQAGKLTCTTTMPIDGYCECTAHGMTEGGTVMPSARRPSNATAGGCGAHPEAPGCH